MNTLSTKNTRRIFAALLSAACLLPTLASCGAKQNPASPEAQAENAVQTGYSTDYPTDPAMFPRDMPGEPNGTEPSGPPVPDDDTVRNKAYLRIPRDVVGLLDWGSLTEYELQAVLPLICRPSELPDRSALSDEEYYTALTEAAVRAFIKKTGMPTRKYRDIYYNVWIYSSPICLGEETDAVERFRRCTDWNIMPILREFRDMLLDYLKNSDIEARAALYDRINSTVYKKWSPMNEAEALIDRVGADEWNAALERARTYVKENEAFLKNRYADAEGGYDYWWTEAHHQASLQQFTVAGIVRDAGITREELEGLLEKFIFPRYGEGCPTRVESIVIDLDGLYENLDHYADLLGASGYAYPFLVDLLYVGDELMTYAPPDEVQTEIAEQSIRGFMKRW